MQKPKKVIAIIQARQGSTRLPGKVLMEVLDKPLLGYQIERVKRSKIIDEIVIATTNLKKDNAIENFCKKQNINCFRGSEEDVLNRYLSAAQMFFADVIIRLTADCPLIDPKIIDLVVKNFIGANPPLDYLSNTIKRTYPRGMDVEVFSMECLRLADEQAIKPGDREHVTSYIYHHPNLFKIGCIESEIDYSNFRWTVDTQEDFELVSRVISKLYPKNPQFSLKEILEIFKQHPDWLKINAHIQQKS